MVAAAPVVVLDVIVSVGFIRRGTSTLRLRSMLLNPDILSRPFPLKLDLELLADLMHDVVWRIELEAVGEHELKVGLELVCRGILSTLKLIGDGRNIHGVLDHVEVRRDVQGYGVHRDAERPGHTIPLGLAKLFQDVLAEPKSCLSFLSLRLGRGIRKITRSRRDDSTLGSASR